MSIMHEDFRRCEKCSCADFEEKTIVTIPKAQGKRNDFHRHEPVSHIGKEIIYVCVKCGHPLEI
jgi:predicted nucleic-acid-binding Zn-ribbon protein